MMLSATPLSTAPLASMLVIYGIVLPFSASVHAYPQRIITTVVIITNFAALRIYMQNQYLTILVAVTADPLMYSHYIISPLVIPQLHGG